jgi:hypothetical protein
MLLITSLHTKAYLNEYCYWYPMLWVDIPSNMGEDKKLCLHCFFHTWQFLRMSLNAPTCCQNSVIYISIHTNANHSWEQCSIYGFVLNENSMFSSSVEHQGFVSSSYQKKIPHQMLQQQLILMMTRANDLSHIVPMMTEDGWLCIMKWCTWLHD